MARRGRDEGCREGQGRRRRGVAKAAAGRRSRAADGRAGGAEQVVLTGEGTTTGARREARGRGREGCSQRAPKGLGREEEGRA